MSGLPAIPDPAELAALEDPAARVLALVEPASAWLVTASLEQAAEAVAGMAAVEVYLRQIKATEEAVGAAQTIALRARMRRAEVTERPIGRPPGEVFPRGNTLPAQRKDEHRDRVLLRNRVQVEQIAAELSPTGQASRRNVLSYLRRAERRNVDEGARSIVPPDAATVEEGAGWTLLAGKALDVLADWPDGSVDLIVTDPPYPADQLERWTELAELAARLLVPQGVLVALTGQYWLPEVIARVTAHLSYGWTYCQPLPGAHARVMSRHVGQAWKPWLAASNGAWPAGLVDWHDDVLPAVGHEKDRYSWQQSGEPAAYLIERLSPRGGVVLDPFAGSGTYGVAALDAGRRFVGVEADAGRFAMTAGRLREVAA